VASALLYNAGRILTYALIGALFGAMGYSLNIAGFQRYLTISMGVILILYVVIAYLAKANISSYPDNWSVVIWVRKKLSTLLRSNDPSKLVFVGMLNGLLPCGLVYMAIAGAITAGTISGGSLFMALFGLGTLPAMLTLMVLGKYISIQWRNRIRKSIPVFLIILGGLFIIRGMNLGIPYISPKISYELSTAEGCH
jgi:sulfite exporter TauE/SafE